MVQEKYFQAWQIDTWRIFGEFSQKYFDPAGAAAGFDSNFLLVANFFPGIPPQPPIRKR